MFDNEGHWIDDPLDVVNAKPDFSGLGMEPKHKQKGTMTREQAIERWTDIAKTVFWAEGAIAKEWNQKLKAMVGKPSDECEAFAHEYCRAIAIEITNATSDEELAMED